VAMSECGPSQHCAPPRDFGRKPGIAEVDWQLSIAEGDASDPKRTLSLQLAVSADWAASNIARPASTAEARSILLTTT